MTDLPAIRATDLTIRRPRQRAVLARDLGAEVEAALQAAARSAHTARAYRQSIALFLHFVGEALGGEPLAVASKDGVKTTWAFVGRVDVLRRIEPGHLASFRAWREAQGDSANTASVRVYAVCTFLAVCYRDGIISDTQAQRLGVRVYKQRQKRDYKPTGRRLTREEVRMLQAAANLATIKGLRDRALLDLGLYAGLRCDELASLDLGDLKQDAGRWWIIFQGKGQKTRKVKLHDQAYNSLVAWLSATGRVPGQGSGPVFLAVNKGDALGSTALNTSSVNRLVSEYGVKAGLAPATGGNRLSPHDLRRTFARNAYDNGAPLPAIQRALGHADIGTTMTYIGADDSDTGGAVDFVRY